MGDRIGSILFALSLYVFVPVLIARLPMAASWKSILTAYGIWIGGLFFLGLLSSRNIGEAIGWPMIFGLFLTIPAIPLLVWLLRLRGIR